MLPTSSQHRFYTQIAALAFIITFAVLAYVLTGCTKCVAPEVPQHAERLRTTYNALGNGWRVDSLVIQGVDETDSLTNLRLRNVPVNFLEFDRPDIRITVVKDCYRTVGFQPNYAQEVKVDGPVKETYSSALQTSFSETISYVKFSLSYTKSEPGRPDVYTQLFEDYREAVKFTAFGYPRANYLRLNFEYILRPGTGGYIILKK